MKKNNIQLLDPFPKSGDYTSYLFGILISLISFTFIVNTSMDAYTSLSAKKNNNIKDSLIIWQIEPTAEKTKIRKFVEANPDVPENPPDNTNQFSFRDQQAGQPRLHNKKNINQSPKTNGSENSVKIINPIKSPKSIEIPSPTVKDPEVSPSLFSSHKNQHIKSENTLEKADAKNGIFIKNSDSELNHKNSLIAALSTIEKDISSNQESKNQIKQRTRPKISQELISGPIMKSLTDAPRVGSVAIECRLHPYGVYIQKMLQAIEEQWNQLAIGATQYLQRDRLPNLVTWKFTLGFDGSITNLHRIDSGKESLPSELCRQAIASRVPFGLWTDKMIKDFGKSDEITINFRYK